MERTRVADLQAAAAQHHTLNGRQEEVLRLVAAGKTNPEIANLLGMTLDGAKWNVSEILSKLGFHSREEAAEYYRWHNQPMRRVGRWARGFVSFPAAKWVVGGASTMAVAVAVAIGVIMARSEPDPDLNSPARPFVLEATITVSSHAGSIGAAPAGTVPGSFGQPEITVSTLEWSYLSNERYRYRIINTDRDIEVVSDGAGLWTYDGQLHTYQHGPILADYPKEMVVYPSLSLFLGPVPGGSIDQMMLMFSMGNADFSYGRVASETMLGRDVTVFEYRPASRSSDSSGQETGEGAARLWIDEDAMVILRFDSESPGQSFTAVVTAFDDAPKFHPRRFFFDPPAGALETTPDTTGVGRLLPESSNSASLGHGSDGSGTLGFDVPPGFLHITYLPEGFRSVSAEEELSGSEVVGLKVIFKPGEVAAPSPAITVTESVRRLGLSDAQQSGERITLRGVEGFVVTEGGRVRITWAERGHVIVLEGVDVSRDELLLVAERMFEQK